MRAIILAAGRGLRMGKETVDKPKCCTIIAGKTLLQWQLESLRAAGISDILVVRGYRMEMLTGDFKTVENLCWEQTNMAASLTCAEEWLASGPMIVSYSDIVYHPDHIRVLGSSKASVAITADRLWLDLWRLRTNDPLADAEKFREREGFLLEIGGKPATVEEIQGQYMGLLFFQPSGWTELHEVYRRLNREKQARLDMTAWLNLALEESIAINIRYVEGRWCEVDCQNDLIAYERKLRRVDSAYESWTHDWRWS
jgi:choline kinase